MLGVMIVPTGVGAQIGGHAGDAAPAAKLIASCCDKLIIHPNVVNGSDLNEMTEDMTGQQLTELDQKCKQKYGQDWIYDFSLKMCVYLGRGSVIQLPVEKKRTIKIKL